MKKENFLASENPSSFLLLAGLFMKGLFYEVTETATTSIAWLP